MKQIRSLTQKQFADRMDGTFGKVQAKRLDRPLQVRIYSQKLGLDYAFPSDSTNQPYHLASIGKLFTASLVQRLAERGALSLKDPIERYLSKTELEQLFVFRNVNYSSQVSIEHLLGHTSGIADYFEGEARDGRPLIKSVLSEPERHWKPHDLLDFTRDHQQAVGIPGTVFNYSDTGYILLGLLIEQVTGKSFAENLHAEFFRPIKMPDSYLMFYSQPENQPPKPIEKIWFDQTEISAYESLSCDWAGGGIISSTADLLEFSLALRGGQLLKSSSLEQMDVCQHKFRPGIYYGLGMMEIRFAEFFFLLGRLPKIKGHIGVLATHLFYDPLHEAHIIMNFGSNTRMVESFRALIEVENLLQKMH